MRAELLPLMILSGLDFGGERETGEAPEEKGSGEVMKGRGWAYSGTKREGVMEAGEWKGGYTQFGAKKTAVPRGQHE